MLVRRATIWLAVVLVSSSCGIVAGAVAGDDYDAPLPIVIVSPCSQRQTLDAAIEFRNESGLIGAEPALCDFNDFPAEGSGWWSDSDHWWLVLEEIPATAPTHVDVDRLSTDGLDFTLLGSFCKGELELWQRLPSGREVDQAAKDLIAEVALDLEQLAVECSQA